jgi:hypothetical protein
MHRTSRATYCSVHTARALLLGVWILELRESGWPDVWLAAAC